jgi:predicted small integral membrane protein
MSGNGHPRRRWSFVERLGSLPGIATIFTAIMALYMTLVAFGNITDFGTNQQFVSHVLEMDTTFNDDDVMWRAVENDTLQNMGYVGVIVWETLAALVLWYGAWQLFRRLLGGGDWTQARRLASAGLLMVVLLFGLGFITIGGEWFSMWQSSEWNGLEPALQNVILAAFALVFVHLPSRDWTEGRHIAADNLHGPEHARP